MIARLALALGVVAALTALAAPAQASSSGVLKGRLLFYQNNAGYCDSAEMVCIGARYPRSQFGTLQPVRQVNVYLRVASTGSALGQAVTDTSGNFTMSWHSATTAPSFTAEVYWDGVNKDTRFLLSGPDSTMYTFDSPSFTLTSGTTAAAPQDRGDVKWGTAGAPNSLVNLYHSMWMAWNFALAPSNLMQSRFTAVRALAFGAFTQCGPSGSCALPGSNVVLIDPDEQYDPFTVAHEMGHIASSRADGHTGANDYCYPSTCASGSDPKSVHEFDTPEWLAATFEESFADLIGNIALWAPTAADARVCHTNAGSCLTPVSLEYTPITGCTDTLAREELMSLKFLWDLYDSHVDSNFNENRSYGPDLFFDTLGDYVVGTGDHMTNEPWNAAMTAVDNKDGRSPADFLFGVDLASSPVRLDPVTFPALTPADTLFKNNCGKAL
jgi:hypothetical protein